MQRHAFVNSACKVPIRMRHAEVCQKSVLILPQDPCSSAQPPPTGPDEVVVRSGASDDPELPDEEVVAEEAVARRVRGVVTK